MVFILHVCLFIAALRSPAGKGLTSWLFCMFYSVFVTFPCGVLGHMWYLIISIPDGGLLTYFIFQNLFKFKCLLCHILNRIDLGAGVLFNLV